MIVDFDSVGAERALQCDVCIVGGGAVGLTLAVPLAEAGVDVLVLEGGGQTLENRSQALQRGESVGHPSPTSTLAATVCSAVRPPFGAGRSPPLIAS